MLKVAIFVTATFAALCAAPLSAGAQTGGAPAERRTDEQRELDPCWNPQLNEAVGRVAACTALIESGAETGVALAGVYFNRAGAFMRLPEPDKARALADLNRALEIIPSMHQAYVLRGQIYAERGNFDRALADFDFALALAPDFHQANYQRGILYSDRGDHLVAMRDFDRAAELSPRNYAYHAGRCRVRLRAGSELDAGRAACDTALNIRPDLDSALVWRGMIALKQERWQDAWNDFDAAMRLAPDEHTMSQFGRGLAAERLGRRDEARADMAGALAIHDDVDDEFAELGLRPRRR